MPCGRHHADYLNGRLGKATGHRRAREQLVCFPQERQYTTRHFSAGWTVQDAPSQELRRGLGIEVIGEDHAKRGFLNITHGARGVVASTAGEGAPLVSVRFADGIHDVTRECVRIRTRTRLREREIVQLRGLRKDKSFNGMFGTVCARSDMGEVDADATGVADCGGEMCHRGRQTRSPAYEQLLGSRKVEEAVELDGSTNVSDLSRAQIAAFVFTSPTAVEDKGTDVTDVGRNTEGAAARGAECP
jgi:hypothetical protein